LASEEHGLEPEKVEKAREFLRAKFAPRFIILFGSAATGKGTSSISTMCCR